MRDNYTYFEWEGAPCRVQMDGDHYGAAQIYRAGVGFVHAPLSSLFSEGKVLSKQEFERMVMAVVMASKRSDDEAP
jgi:hypothetical protein